MKVNETKSNEYQAPFWVSFLIFLLFSIPILIYVGADAWTQITSLFKGVSVQLDVLSRFIPTLMPFMAMTLLCMVMFGAKKTTEVLLGVIVILTLCIGSLTVLSFATRVASTEADTNDINNNQD